MQIDKVKKSPKLKRDHKGNTPSKGMEYTADVGIDSGNNYHELVMSSHYVNTHRDVGFSNTPASLHSHNFYEILYCHNPADLEYLIASKRYRLQKGDIIFMPPGTSHRPLLPEKLSGLYETDVLWISQEYMNSITAMSPDKALYPMDYILPIRTIGTGWEFLGDLFRSGVLEEEVKRPGWEVAVIGNTLTILANMKRAYIERSADTMKAEKPELVDQITAYIEDNYTTHITVDDIAKKFYVSSSSISHLFKEKMGISIYSYITQRRLIAAKTLILDGEILDSVSAQAGFPDYSSFYRAFKHEYGISPRQFRKLQESNDESI